MSLGEKVFIKTFLQAATLLKRTEGVVTLILSNPTKKSENVEADDNKASVLKTSGPPSRVVTPVPGKPLILFLKCLLF